MIEPLSSLQNPRIKNAVKLRSRRARDQQRRFLVEGFRELTRAVAARLPIEDLYVCPELYLGENERALVEGARIHCGAKILPVTAPVFEKIAYRDRPEGLLAVAPQPRRSLDDLTPSAVPFYVIACAIEKPGNLGTILRSADAAGCDGVIVCDRCTDIFNPNVVRASIGTLFSLPVAESTSDEVLPWLRQHGIRAVATSPDSEQSIWDADLQGAVAIVVGSEQFGLAEPWLTGTDLQVRIPMQGAIDSLNAATATSVVLFEVLRQRSKGGSTGS